MTTKQLHFKWTISRGLDTYGYNICTLLVDGEKVGKTCGGGYDMQGTIFAQWIENHFQENLIQYFSDDITTLKNAIASGVEDSPNTQVYNTKSGKRYRRSELQGMYGSFLTIEMGETVKVKISLDGACGFDSIKRVAEAIGITLKWNPESEKYKNHTYYTAIIN